MPIPLPPQTRVPPDTSISGDIIKTQLDTSSQVPLSITQESILPGVIKQRHLVPSPTQAGDLYYGKDGNSFSNVPIGTKGSLLNVSGGIPSWLSPGTNGQVLTVAGGVPTYQSPTGGVSLVFSQTEAVTVANTLTTTTLLGSGFGSPTLPANYLEVGKTIRITGVGLISTDSAFPPSPDLDIELLLGATPVAITGSQPLPPDGTISNLGGTSFGISVVITCYSVGVTGSVLGMGEFNFSIQNGVSVFGYTVGYPMVDNAPTPTPIDTTGSLLIDLTATWDVASVNNSITLTNLIIESVF